MVPEQIVNSEGKLVKLPEPAITAEGVKTLASLKGLTELHLSNKKLTDKDLAPLGELTGLEKLTIFAPPVTDKGMAFLPKLKQLAVLDLRGTQVTTGLIPTLRTLPKLRALTVPVFTMDPKNKNKLADYRRLLPRVNVQSALGPHENGFPIFGGGGFGPGGGKR
jgi:hypothetical protein